MDASVQVAKSSPEKALSFWRKAAYAIGDLGNSAGPGTIIPFWYLYFLTDVAKLNPALAGVSHALVARYFLCGLEWQIVWCLGLIAFGSFFVAGILLLGVVWVTVRKARAARRPSA